MCTVRSEFLLPGKTSLLYHSDAACNKQKQKCGKTRLKCLVAKSVFLIPIFSTSPPKIAQYYDDGTRAYKLSISHIFDFSPKLRSLRMVYVLSRFRACGFTTIPSELTSSERFRMEHTNVAKKHKRLSSTT
mmetsp:Transcript_16638/g.31645  ORF Transcript_16638/g.31645 Transcript_16638/m.31645 type:complete len:131 (+) Transcript_16638:642-1034(+)